MTQEAIDARRKGWAIEVRVNRRPRRRISCRRQGRCLPGTPAGAGMRMPISGLRQGGVISPFYDSMQAKLIAVGATREQARHKLLQMLDETVLLGVSSNRDFLAQIVAHPVFADGRFSTGFIAEHFPAETISASREPDSLHVALAAALLYRTAADALQASAGIDPNCSTGKARHRLPSCSSSRPARKSSTSRSRP